MLSIASLLVLADEATTTTATDSVSPVRLLTIFVLAIYVGVEVITKIPPTLHTPLMSGSNAISGITLIGAILSAGQGNMLFMKILGSVAVAFAMINVVGGFLVTHRMLGMFQKKK
ncbi:MAG: NAD(P) transhydrogenase subunit alpha [Planctomycetes bacterium]|nr:NAD(P) transhydrogenase subunit alpha [Planctomycetota bacterium]